MRSRLLALVLAAVLLVSFCPAAAAQSAAADTSQQNAPAPDTSGYSVYPGMAAYMAQSPACSPIDLSQGAFAYRYLDILEYSQVTHINVMALSVQALDDNQYITVFLADNRSGEILSACRFYAKAEDLTGLTPNAVVSLYPQQSLTVGPGQTLMFGQAGDTLAWGYVPQDESACHDLKGCWKNSSLSQSMDGAILCIDVRTAEKPGLAPWEQELKQAFQGKKLSILGDSICAFWGVSNSLQVNNTLANNRGWYGNPQLLTSHEETWWAQMESRYSLELLVNNSWCSSSVTTLHNGVGEASYGWNTRPENLHDNTLDNNPGGLPINPDIIAIYMGFNDLRGEVSCQEEITDAQWAKIEAEGYIPPTASDFQLSYALMVCKARRAYPNAQIYLFTHPAGSYLERRQSYNLAIKAIAEHYGCHVVDLYNSPISNYRCFSFDSVHPTAAGMAVMADLFAQELARVNLGRTPQPLPGTPNTPGGSDYTGLAKDASGNYYYFVDGKIDTSFTGLVDNAAGRWYVLRGQVQMRYDGLIEFEGVKYLIKAGHVNTAFTGISKQQGVYYYFTQGVNDLAFEGLVYCNGMKVYAQNGQVNFNKTAVVASQGELLLVKYGIWRNTYKGLARLDSGQWVFMRGGAFDESYTGVAKLNANWVYVAAGYVDSLYCGTVTVNSVDYTVKYGVVQF